jgi:hypothetical protein
VRTVPNRPGLLRLGACVTLLLSVALVLQRGGAHHLANGDTAVLVKGLPSISKCLSRRILIDCNAHLSADNLPTVSKFPLIQTFPAYVFHVFGASAATVTDLLGWLNAIVTVAFIGSACWWCYHRAGLRLAVLCGLLLAPGMLIPYSGQTLAEPLAAAALCGTVLAAARRDRVSPWLLGLAILAVTGKETAAPFVILFGLAGVAFSGAARPVARRAAVTLAVGAAIGVALSATFNVFRYGSLLNLAYLDEPRPLPASIPLSAAGFLISPNASIALFWPGAAVAVVVLVMALLRGSPCTLGERRVRAGAALALIGFFGTIAALSLWWDPYGWYAWGPRLLLPAACAVIVLVLPVLGEQSLYAWLTAPAVMGLAAMAILATLPSIGEVFMDVQSTQIIATWRDRLECSPASHLPRTPELSASCAQTETWRVASMPLVAAVRRQPLRGWYWPTAVLASLSIGFWLSSIRRDARAPAIVGHAADDPLFAARRTAP